jgi:hypothetical protein
VENQPPFYTAVDHMVPSSRNQHSQCPRHDLLSSNNLFRYQAGFS